MPLVHLPNLEMISAEKCQLESKSLVTRKRAISSWLSCPLAPWWVDWFRISLSPCNTHTKPSEPYCRLSKKLDVLKAGVVYSWLGSDLRDWNTCTQANTLIRNTKINTDYNYYHVLITKYPLNKCN
jgi:hypothetical protein